MVKQVMVATVIRIRTSKKNRQHNDQKKLVSCAETAYPSAAPEVTPVISGVRVTRSLVLCVCSVYRCLSLCPFSFSHCVVCSSSMYGFCLPLWYLQTLLAYLIATNVYKIIVVVNFITFTAGYHSNGRFPYGI
jgi:hypothetical protein